MTPRCSGQAVEQTERVPGGEGVIACSRSERAEILESGSRETREPEPPEVVVIGQGDEIAAAFPAFEGAEKVRRVIEGGLEPVHVGERELPDQRKLDDGPRLVGDLLEEVLDLLAVLGARHVKVPTHEPPGADAMALDADGIGGKVDDQDIAGIDLVVGSGFGRSRVPDPSASADFGGGVAIAEGDVVHGAVADGCSRGRSGRRAPGRSDWARGCRCCRVRPRLVGCRRWAVRPRSE